MCSRFVFNGELPNDKLIGKHEKSFFEFKNKFSRHCGNNVLGVTDLVTGPSEFVR